MQRLGRNSIVLSFREGTSTETVSHVVRRAAEGLAAFGTNQISRLSITDTTILLTDLPLTNLSYIRNTFVLLHSKTVLSSEGFFLTAEDLLKAFLKQGNECFSALEPPFAVIAGNAAGTTAASDPLGLVHLYFWQGASMAAMASSAALIGRVFGLPLSFDAIFQRMTVGHCIGETTSFMGVEMLPQGSRARIEKGQVSLFSCAIAKQSFVARGAVDLGRDAIGTAVMRCLSGLPDCGIELTGGLDTRMILAAIPPDLRVGRKAYTIGYADTPDVIIAKKLATRCRLDHVFIDLTQFADESSADAWQRAHRIAHRDDFETNVFDRLTIDCVEDVLRTCPRMGGIGGELARGFYYPMLDIASKTNKASIERLIKWKLTVNDSAPRTLFDNAYLSTCEVFFREKVKAEIENGPQPFGNALDWFYLRQRMRHWAGAAISSAMLSRTVFTPLFHPEYIAWTMQLRPSEKKNSVVFSSVLSRFDAELATIPLDSGLIPSQLGKGSITSLIPAMKKLFGKVRQISTNTHRSNIGSSFSKKLCQREIIEQINWGFLHSIPLFSGYGLEMLHAGKLPWTRTSLGYITALHFQKEYLDLDLRNQAINIAECATGTLGVN